MAGFHTAHSISMKLYKIFDIFQINKSKISTLVSDIASNMKALATVLKVNYYGCFAHLINLFVNRAVNMKYIIKSKKQIIDANELIDS